MESKPPLFGGWTPTWDGDLCAGGHPPQSVLGNECNRCGRQVDKSRCLCGTEGHADLSRSMCPVRMRFDRRDAEIHLVKPVTHDIDYGYRFELLYEHSLYLCGRRRITTNVRDLNVKDVQYCTEPGTNHVSIMDISIRLCDLHLAEHEENTHD